jgi:hypothetical protein
MSFSDTTPEAAAIQRDIYRKMSGERRLKIAFELSDALRKTAMSRIRRENPQWSDWEVKRELLRIAFLPAPLPRGLP